MGTRRVSVLLAVMVVAVILGVAWFWRPIMLAFLVVGPLLIIGALDIFQKQHALRRNFPVLARFRYLAESVRPELQQYFVESNSSGRPFSRQLRTVAYQRAKNVRDTVPFGTEEDVYAVGYEWMSHSLAAHHPPEELPRVRIGGEACSKPYSAAMLNISAMSYGSLSAAAIRALNLGAKLGGFAHNTGEGSISDHHLEGGDLIWQIGTGYFGCRSRTGGFDPESFRVNAAQESVKMIEIKLSQGAKPGHGGILPAAKVTKEIARIRLVPLGEDVLSPPNHSAFDTPVGLCNFIAQLRELSGGKPVGFKLCLGKRREFLAICKAFLKTGIYPDFISVDGGEGGTGAAPLEFTNVLGSPLDEAIIFVHNALVGIDKRDEIKIIASGRIITGFDMAHKIAIGADLCYSARGMMFALGCIQAQRCNSNDCPTGVATQDVELAGGLDPTLKSVRVANFQRNTVKAFTELIAAAGLPSPSALRPWHIHRRVTQTQVQHYGEMYEFIEPRALLSDMVPKAFARPWQTANPDSFAPLIIQDALGFEVKAAGAMDVAPEPIDPAGSGSEGERQAMSGITA